MNQRIVVRDAREREVVRLWRSGHLSAASILLYLQWVRRFRAYCHEHHLSEESQLTRAGAVRFTKAYVGPRTTGPVSVSTCSSAWTALHAWACALHGLGIPVPQWRRSCVPVRKSAVITAYCQYRRSHCGIAETTLRRDVEIAEAFLSLLRSRGRSARQAKVVDTDAFVQQMAARVAKRTVADGCSSLRSFLRFLCTTGRLRCDLASTVMAPRVRVAERPPRALPWADVRRLLRAIPQKRPPGKRDFAMLLMMATYGFGAAEVLGLQFEDVDWKSAVLRARRPKTGVRIELPLLPAVARALTEYLRAERPPSAEARRIFLGAKMPYRPITSGAIRHRIRLYARCAGIDAEVIGAHAIRHSHATRQIDEGANLKVVSDILGHRHPSSTSVYVRVALRRLRTVALPVPR